MEAATSRALATGGAMFAGFVMLMIGALEILLGIAAIGENRVFTTASGETFVFSLAGWGWIYLILGVVVLATGIGVLMDKDWANLAGMVVTILVVINNFFFLPYHWLWSLIMIALGIFVIWSLAKQLDRGEQVL